jgi:hypothetical protein
MEYMEYMEYYEVYDKKGNPTGVVESRETVHDKGLWHATVHVWIYTEGGAILIQKRSRGKDSHPGLWDISLKPDREEVATFCLFNIRDLRNLLADPARRTGFVPHGE